MAKKQIRIRQKDLESKADQWLGRSLSLVMKNGAVFELHAGLLEAGVLWGRDAAGIKHKAPIVGIKEIILNFPVAEHAQTSAD